jgi:hypothetical protein
MKRIFLSVFMVLLSVTLCYAGKNDINAAAITTSDALKDLTKEVGYAIAIPSMTSADPMGITGFDIGVEASSYKLDAAKNFFDDSSLLLTRVHIQKGLPFDIDIGLEFSEAYESNIKSIGGEIRWGVFGDGLATPAVGLRATYSKLDSVTDVDITTYTLGAQISKEVLFITPYAGTTYISSKGEVENSGLESEKETSSNVYVGVNFSLLVINLALQADISDNTMYTLKFGVGF